MEYTDYLTSDHWRIVVAEAKRRAGHKCLLCGRTDLPLEVHHNDYTRVGMESPNDVIVLCWKCHRRHHDTLDRQRRSQATAVAWLPFEPEMPDGADFN